MDRAASHTRHTHKRGGGHHILFRSHRAGLRAFLSFHILSGYRPENVLLPSELKTEMFSHRVGLRAFLSFHILSGDRPENVLLPSGLKTEM